MWVDRQIVRQTDRDKQIQIDRQTDKQTDRQTDRQVDRQTDRQTDRQVDRQTDRQIGRQTDRQVDRQTETDRQVDRIDRQIGGQTYRLIGDRQTDRQVDRQRDRQTDRQIVAVTFTSVLHSFVTLVKFQLIFIIQTRCLVYGSVKSLGKLIKLRIYLQIDDLYHFSLWLVKMAMLDCAMSTPQLKVPQLLLFVISS